MTTSGAFGLIPLKISKSLQKYFTWKRILNQKYVPIRSLYVSSSAWGKKAIPLGETHSYLRSTSDKGAFERRKRQLETHLEERGYPLSFTQPLIECLPFNKRNDLLTTEKVHDSTTWNQLVERQTPSQPTYLLLRPKTASMQQKQSRRKDDLGRSMHINQDVLKVNWHWTSLMRMMAKKPYSGEHRHHEEDHRQHGEEHRHHGEERRHHGEEHRHHEAL